MSDMFDVGDAGDLFDVGDLDSGFADVDANGIPDVHEMPFINTSGAPVPDAINGGLDRDGDGIPDHVDTQVDVGGDGISDHIWFDSRGDGMNDWVDPFSTLPGHGLSPEATLHLAIEHVNPFFRA